MYRLMFFRLLVVLLLVVLDQATKQLAISELVPGVANPVFPWLNWTLLFNRGAAFSLLADAGGWQRLFLVAISIGVAGVITVMLWRLPAQQKLQSSALVLLLAGALGNLIDRLRFGEVTDFIQVHYAGWYFPAFNVADSAITVGVIALIWVELSNWRSESMRRGDE
ncbi:MAG: signal peptidase II [Immundisolibacteraceae bacterium]|nr:signal peptidase II [Immundisolibacteraceae bacterium]